MTATSLPPSQDLVSVDVTAVDDRVRLTVVGEVDSSSAPALRAALGDVLVAGVTQVIVDLDGVTFLDSAGLCVLAGAHRQATELGLRLRILASGRPVIRPLQLTGLWELLDVEQVEPSSGAA